MVVAGRRANRITRLLNNSVRQEIVGTNGVQRDNVLPAAPRHDDYSHMSIMRSGVQTNHVHHGAGLLGDSGGGATVVRTV